MYTRWGRTVCPQGATLVYAGRAAGTNYNVKGGTSDTLCMPETPQYLSTDTTDTFIARFGGLEYDQLGTSTPPINNLLQANPPVSSAPQTPNCLFSLSLLSTPVLMDGAWNNEWSTTATYLMAELERSDRQCKSTLCVDKDTEAVPGSQADNNTKCPRSRSVNAIRH